MLLSCSSLPAAGIHCHRQPCTGSRLAPRRPWHIQQGQFTALRVNFPVTPSSRVATCPSIPGDGQGSTTDLEPQRPSLGQPDSEPLDVHLVPASAANGASAASSAGALLAGAEQGFPHRWKVVLMMALAFVLCNMDKVNMSVAVIPMAADLGWGATERGIVSSAFFWGYTLTQIPGGWISTRVGGAKVLAVGVALWSVGTLVAPPAAHLGLWALCALRVLVGLGEGFAPAAATSVLARIVPAGERSRAVSVVWGGLDVGSAIGLLLSGPLIRAYGWPSVFYLFALLGLVWCVFWPLLTPDTVASVGPEPARPSGPAGSQPAAATQAAAAHAAAAQPPASKASSSNSNGVGDNSTVPWGKFMRSRPVWAIIIAHFSFNWGYYTLLAWLPSYFELALGLNVEKSSFLTLIPYLAMTVMMPFVGSGADNLVARGMSLTNVRKLCQGVAFVGPALCMLACAVLTPVPYSGAAGAAAAPTALLVGLLSVGFALGAWSRAGLYCNHQDLSPKYASALLGITNTAGALPGVLGVTSAGYLLDLTNSWALALFLPTAACQLVGAAFYVWMASSERQEWS